MKRADLANEVATRHRSLGGLEPRAADLYRLVQRALMRMREDDEVAPGPGFAMWRLAGSISDAPSEQTDEGEEEAPRPDKEIGDGAESVYLYFDPNDRELAALKGQDVWECKIGRTDGAPRARILSQGARTARAHEPVIGLVIRTDDSGALERAIHASLRLADADCIDSPGTEWFLTSPARIERWYETFLAAQKELVSSSNSA